MEKNIYQKIVNVLDTILTEMNNNFISGMSGNYVNDPTAQEITKLRSEIQDAIEDESEVITVFSGTIDTNQAMQINELLYGNINYLSGENRATHWNYVNREIHRIANAKITEEQIAEVIPLDGVRLEQITQSMPHHGEELRKRA